MRLVMALVLSCGILFSVNSWSYDIGLVPLHEFSDQQGKTWGLNISLHASLAQVRKMRRWIAQIAATPKGLETLRAIDQSGHKLLIKHSVYALVSSGKASAPMSAALIDGRGESVDIYFNFDIPDSGSHLVFDTHRQPIEYTATQNLFHELSHARHMMRGTWHYASSERQAIDEENEFRRQQAQPGQTAYAMRVFVNGEPICPEFPERVDDSWQQGIICY
jgi:hypothetical protein